MLGMTEINNTTRPLCRRTHIAPRPLAPNLNPQRKHFVSRFENVWANGTRLHYCFIQQPPADRPNDPEVVRDAFRTWKNIGIGLEFEQVLNPADAEIRIAFLDDGSWSYVGRQALTIKDPTEPTMNFGWSLTGPDGRDTALHEIGHALGLEHEHQNANNGIVWNRDAVIASLSAPPNSWSVEEIQHNVFDKVTGPDVVSTAWDRNSIMHYPFEAGLIDVPAEFRTKPLIPAGGLSGVDIQQSLALYPGTMATQRLSPFASTSLSLAPGQQVDFVIVPEISREYTISTFGALDTVMVLFEQVNGIDHFVAGDDDGGTERNARIVQRLLRGHEYRLRVRLYHARVQGEGAVMVW